MVAEYIRPEVAYLLFYKLFCVNALRYLAVRKRLERLEDALPVAWARGMDGAKESRPSNFGLRKAVPSIA